MSIASLKQPLDIHAIWRHQEHWHVGRQPLQSLTAHTLDTLVATLNQTEALLQKWPNAVACGVLAYDAGATLAGINSKHSSALLHVHIFQAEEISVVEQPSDLASTPFELDQPFRSDIKRADYELALKNIHDYLLAGDCYQINFSRRFSTSFSGDAIGAWLRLAATHTAPHSSFFRCPDGDHVFGVSPERFLRIHDRKILTEPIKGSRPRHADSQTDQALGEELKSSTKDRAENLMIVDLLRNDLGAICETGSVVTEALFDLRRFSNVQHLVSTISGRLKDSVSPLQALLSCFPGGSITGAPKKRAMEIINQLEMQPRGFYCGTQFSLTADGQLDSNILIRSFQTSGNRIVCHGGGGIVIDSDTEQEFLESGFKIAALMAALDSND